VNGRDFLSTAATTLTFFIGANPERSDILRYVKDLGELSTLGIKNFQRTHYRNG
jgi:hypothetical protein